MQPDERTSAAAGTKTGCESAAGSNNAGQTHQELRGRPFHAQELLCVKPDYGAGRQAIHLRRKSSNT